VLSCHFLQSTLWTNGFYVATIGEGGGLDAIRAYVAKQGIPSQNLKLFD